MNGVDAIAFTAGIGENTTIVRAKVLEYLGYLGITVDAQANEVHGEEKVISTARFQSKSLCDPDQRGACNRKRDGCTCKIGKTAGL